MLKAIHGQEDRRAAQAKAAEVVSRLKEIGLRTAAELVEQKGHEALTCLHSGVRLKQTTHSRGTFARSDDAHAWSVHCGRTIRPYVGGSTAAPHRIDTSGESDTT